MEWAQIWRTVFTGWDGDVDLAALARELASAPEVPHVGDEREAADWVRRQIQEAY